MSEGSLEHISGISSSRKSQLQHDPRLLVGHQSSTDGGVAGGDLWRRSDHTDVDSDMSDNWLEAGSSSDSLGYTVTAIGRGDNDTRDVVEVGSVVDKSGVGLLVTKKRSAVITRMDVRRVM